MEHLGNIYRAIQSEVQSITNMVSRALKGKDQSDTMKKNEGVKEQQKNLDGRIKNLTTEINIHKNRLGYSLTPRQKTDVENTIKVKQNELTSLNNELNSLKQASDSLKKTAVQKQTTTTTKTINVEENELNRQEAVQREAVQKKLASELKEKLNNNNGEIRTIIETRLESSRITRYGASYEKHNFKGALEGLNGDRATPRDLKIINDCIKWAEQEKQATEMLEKLNNNNGEIRNKIEVRLKSYFILPDDDSEPISKGNFTILIGKLMEGNATPKDLERINTCIKWAEQHK